MTPSEISPADDSISEYPSIDDARLPAVYESAQKALAECSRIDECQSWANKSEALASYAKQAKNDGLRKMADRIQARAIRRCGELLKQIKPATGAHLKSEGNHTLSRKQAAKDAGLSDHQRTQSLRVASIPKPEFDDCIETDTPATVSKLAAMGTQKQPPKPVPLVDLKGIPPADYARATEAQGTLRDFAEFCEEYPPGRIANAFHDHEFEPLKKNIFCVQAWLDEFAEQVKQAQLRVKQ